MLDTQRVSTVTPQPGDAASSADRRSIRYLGPDRRRSAAKPRDWLAAVLDELDHGVMVLSPGGEVVYLNHAAAVELDAVHPLRRVGRRLHTLCAADTAKLQEAVRNASQRRLRKLVFLEGTGQPVGVSVVPLPDAAPVALVGEEGAPVLLVLGKQTVCEALSVQGFAANCQLTNAEARVLGALCTGLSPTRISRELGVAISTVRTHIGTIRVKTRAESIRALVAQVARLPPLRGTLRQPSFTRLARSRDADEAFGAVQ